MEAVTADARRYGFHCTLKAPFRLTGSYLDFRNDVAAVAGAVHPFDLPPLVVGDLSGFLALQETLPSPALQALADLCVAWLDHHRAPPTTAELEQRRGTGLSPDENLLLLRWGYPAVFSRWRFHMTLTCRLPPDARSVWRHAAERHFAAALEQPRRVKSICVFTQAGSGAPFLLAERLPLA